MESAFVPKKCVCTIDPAGSMKIQLFNRNTDEEEFTAAGIDSSRLTTGRAIANVVLALREEARLWRLMPERQRHRA
jgi:hypothetical protein